MSATWIVERTANRRFPYRVSIEQGGQPLIAVRAQAAWPGPGQQIFCLRERAFDPAEPLETVERVPVAHLTNIGRKITVVLDRPNRKRCEFLVISKPYRDANRGMHEQIFFRTESGIRAHRSRTHLEIRAEAALSIAIDIAEKYPWRFPGAALERRQLRVGDYALIDGEHAAALIERKTFDNLLGELGAVQALHHQLADLESHAVAALVIEAEYGDFLNPKRLAGRWPAAFVAKALGEIAALHPKLPVIFAGNRKHANLWAQQFFSACAGRSVSPQMKLVREVTAKYDPTSRDESLDRRIAELALSQREGFQISELMRWFPHVPLGRIRRVLHTLRASGRLRCTGRGPSARWVTPDVLR